MAPAPTSAPVALIPPIPAKPKPKAKRKLRFTICRAYRELPVKGGGIMRAEKGDYIVTAPDGTVSVKPPSVFAIEHPKLAR